MDRKDWLMLLLGAEDAGGATPPLGRAWVEKCLFVVAERLPQAREARGGFYRFTTLNYGPSDPDVARDAQVLQAEGLIVGLDGSYRATEAGRARARALAGSDPSGADYLRRCRAWAGKLSFSELLRAIHAEWPEMRAGSVFFTG